MKNISLIKLVAGFFVGATLVVSGFVSLPVARAISEETPTQGTIIVAKNIINDNGGTKNPEDFTMNVTATNPSLSTFPGSITGTPVNVDPGEYSVDETADGGYAKTLGPGCSGTIAAGETKICSITNDDKELLVIVNVINGVTGTKHAGDFEVTASGTNPNPGSFMGSSAGVYVSLGDGPYDADIVNFGGYTKERSEDCLGSINHYDETGDEGARTCTITLDDVDSSWSQGPIVGSGGGGTVLGVSTTTPTSTEPTPPPAEPQAPAAANVCEPYLNTYLRFGADNDPEAVKNLQGFLNKELGLDIPLTGVFGQMTLEAVKQFQLKYKDDILAPWLPFGLASDNEATGYVYKTTLRKINLLNCSTLDSAMPQLP